MSGPKAPLSTGIRHAWATRAGIDWRSHPELDALTDEEFVAVIRTAWTPELRRESAEVWTAERREAARQAASLAWRQRNPEKAAVRDEIEAAEVPGPCDMCGDPDSVLFVIDYATKSHLWRCRRCAREARR